jgi:hypothetical protein
MGTLVASGTVLTFPGLRFSLLKSYSFFILFLLLWGGFSSMSARGLEVVLIFKVRL